jgi:hypothetical protein
MFKRLVTAIILSLLVASLTVGCVGSGSDESTLREEFGIPSEAKVVSYEAFPDESQWGPREGLEIRIVFQLSADEFEHYLDQNRVETDWHLLPIPDAFIRRMAATETRMHWSDESELQMVAEFSKWLPQQPSDGFFHVRTAGDDIMNATRTVLETPDRDLNDFMLVMLDASTKQIIVTVSTSY